MKCERIRNIFCARERALLAGHAGPVSLALVAGMVCALLPDAVPGQQAGPWLLPVLAATVWRPLRVVAAFCLGFLLTVSAMQQALANRLPLEQDRSRQVVQGRVAGLVSREPGRLRFMFVLDPAPPRGPSRLRLSWYRATELPRPGESWRLQVTLRSPRGLSNPGGFDYERWLLRKRIHATGYVRHGQRLGPPIAGRPGWLAAGRDRIRQVLEERLSPGTPRSLLLALVLGDRQTLSAEDRQVLAATGTSHLLAISGLHVGLVAGAVYALVTLCWNRVMVGGRPRGQGPAWAAAVLAAAGYACLAGLAVPTRRAVLMLLVLGLLSSLRRPAGGWHGLFLALGLVCLVDPLAVLGLDLWLSFLAVACIGLVVRGHRHNARPGWRDWPRVQLAITIGMAPLLAGSFGQVSLLSPVVNLVLVPWFGLAILPPLLLAVVLLPLLPWAAGQVLELQLLQLSLIWQALQWLAIPGSVHVGASGLTGIVLVSIGTLAVFLPRGVPGRLAGLLCWTVLVFPRKDAPLPGGMELTVLDVGQGLSAVLRTENHVLVYDTAPAYQGRAVADQTLLPFLRSRQVRRVDRLVISHSDNDHSGGRERVLGAMEVLDQIAGEPLPGARACVAGERWNWDGVDFEILHPQEESRLEGNEASCVLLATGSGGRVLFTGDITGAIERRLVRNRPCLEAEVVLAAHHGSGTSSTVAVVKATAPDWVVYAAGFGNRWGFPVREVRERWKLVKARALVTGETGAVTFQLAPDGHWSLGLQRRDNPRPWLSSVVSGHSDVQYDSGNFPKREARGTCSKLSAPADG